MTKACELKKGSLVGIHGGAHMLAADIQLIIGKGPQKTGTAHGRPQALAIPAQFHIRGAKAHTHLA